MRPASMSDEAFNAYLKAGEIAQAALRYGAALIKPGVKVRDVLDQTEAKIRELGGEIAFPAQSSIDACAAHYCPDDHDETAYADNQIVKLDVGVHVDGYVADNALSVSIGAEHQALVDAARAALDAAVKLATPGTTPGEIGRIIEQTITSRGFEPVRNLCGHGIGRYTVHASPSMPNHHAPNLTTPLEKGQTIAIEPFATTGSGMVEGAGEASVFMLMSTKPIRHPIARSVLATIRGYHGLPFTTRWLEREHGRAKTLLALRELERNDIINAYPPLVERSGGLVAQAEHSIIVAPEPIITTRWR